MRFLLILILVFLTPRPLLAHDGGAIPADVWSHWNADPLVLIGLLLPLTLYMRGTATYRVNRWRSAGFIAGTVMLFITLVSPLEAVSGALFSGHMLQHLLLILVAVPLLTFSRPLPALLRGSPHRWRKAFGSIVRVTVVRGLWAWLTYPLGAMVLHVLVLWLWHLPGLYSLALENPAIHGLEHASFLITAALFWWSLRSTEDYGERVLSVFGVMMASGLLGALMTFANIPWYHNHEAYVGFWGLSLLEDQQLAGLLMWIPAGVVYIVTAAVVLGMWNNGVERSVAEREHRLAKEMGDV